MVDRQAIQEKSEAPATGSDALKVPMNNESDRTFFQQGQAALSEATAGLVGSGTLPGLEIMQSGQTVRTEAPAGSDATGAKAPEAQKPGGTNSGDSASTNDSVQGTSGTEANVETTQAPGGGGGTNGDVGIQDGSPKPAGSKASSENSTDSIEPNGGGNSASKAIIGGGAGSSFEIGQRPIPPSEEPPAPPMADAPKVGAAQAPSELPPSASEQ